MTSDDLLLQRLTYVTTKAKLTPIPWPEGLAPTPAHTFDPVESLPACDVLVVTWTAAEAQALADVLTPGHPSSTWQKYTKNYDAYASHFTWKSPARESKALAIYWPITIGDTKVLCVKSDLHLATDDTTMPLRALWKQMVEDTGAKLVITTGTAGGVGAGTVEGDVLVTGTAHFDCQRAFKDQSFANSTFSSGYEPNLMDVTDLLAVNADKLKPVATRAPRILGGEVLTTDFFAYANDADTYGLRAYDPSARMVEMDDASLGLACAEDIPNPPEWVSVRNASDPQISASIGDLAAQAKWAETIYQEYGYYTTIGSVIVTWAVIVSKGKP